MLRRKIKNSQLTFILPLVGVGVAFVLLYLLPRFRENNRQRELIQLKTDFINQSNALTSQINDVEREHRESGKHCQQWQSAAPAEAELPKIHKEINERVAYSGATVTGFSPLEPVRMKTLLRFPLLLKASGTFAQIHAMLANLESLPGSTWMEDVKLRAAGKNTDVMNCEVTLVVFGKNSEDSN